MPKHLQQTFARAKALIFRASPRVAKVLIFANQARSLATHSLRGIFPHKWGWLYLLGSPQGINGFFWKRH